MKTFNSFFNIIMIIFDGFEKTTFLNFQNIFYFFLYLIIRFLFKEIRQYFLIYFVLTFGFMLFINIFFVIVFSFFWPFYIMYSFSMSIIENINFTQFPVQFKIAKISHANELSTENE